MLLSRAFLTLGLMLAGTVAAVTVPLRALRGLFNTAVTNVALKCFNLRPERKAAIIAWMNVQNTSVFRRVDSDFGPMNLQFSRSLNSAGEYWTSVSLTRSGVPGVSPRGNCCTP